MEAEKLFYSIPECCRALSCGRTQLYKWLDRPGGIEVTRIGRKVLVHRDELKQFAEHLRSGSVIDFPIHRNAPAGQAPPAEEE
jgi:excisionase family DNA binding protein